MASNTTASSSSGETTMDRRLLEAASCGHAAEMKHLALHHPGVLLGTTPVGNTCLHIASLFGYEEFCKNVLLLNHSPSLLTATNVHGETPLITAVTNGHTTLASFLLRCCRVQLQQPGETILKLDSQGYNALHHAIRNGHRQFALELIAAEPALSHAVNKYDESPMFMAVMRNYEDVFENLLEVSDSADGGILGHNALHAAARNGNSAIAKRIMEVRPELARKVNQLGNAPLQLAVIWDKIDVLKVLLEHDQSLGYMMDGDEDPLLYFAACQGHVGVARELLRHCPDAPYYSKQTGFTSLHTAVKHGQPEFIEFVLGMPQLRKLINMRDENGNTALHLAVQKCNPKTVAALLHHQDLDVTVINKRAGPATRMLFDAMAHAKTLNWNEVSMLMLKADPQDATAIYIFQKLVKDKLTDQSRMDTKSRTQTYTGNTSVVAILIATITFAAAFTLPGGYGNDPGNEGIPIMARKFAFQAFLISDTLAMCSSLAVAFICILARWEDLEFLLYYISFTRKLMWFAYIATTTAFATGLYTVLAPRLQWLAVLSVF